MDEFDRTFLDYAAKHNNNKSIFISRQQLTSDKTLVGRFMIFLSIMAFRDINLDISINQEGINIMRN